VKKAPIKAKMPLARAEAPKPAAKPQEDFVRSSKPRTAPGSAKHAIGEEKQIGTTVAQSEVKVANPVSAIKDAGGSAKMPTRNSSTATPAFANHTLTKAKPCVCVNRHGKKVCRCLDGHKAAEHERVQHNKVEPPENISKAVPMTVSPNSSSKTQVPVTKLVKPNSWQSPNASELPAKKTIGSDTQPVTKIAKPAAKSSSPAGAVMNGEKPKKLVVKTKRVAAKNVISNPSGQNTSSVSTTVAPISVGPNGTINTTHLMAKRKDQSERLKELMAKRDKLAARLETAIAKPEAQNMTVAGAAKANPTLTKAKPCVCVNRHGRKMCHCVKDRATTKLSLSSKLHQNDLDPKEAQAAIDAAADLLVGGR